MDKEILEKYVSEGLSSRKIGLLTNKHHTIVCKHLRKHGLRQKQPEVSHVRCEVCKRKKRNLKKKLCHGCITGIRRLRLKIAMLEYKGGACSDCRLKCIPENYGLFDFHHLDPRGKDFSFSKANTSSWEKLRAELDKCILVCCICHRIRHSEDQLASVSRMRYIKDTHHKETNEIQKLVHSFMERTKAEWGTY